MMGKVYLVGAGRLFTAERSVKENLLPLGLSGGAVAKKNINKVNWRLLSRNPKAIHLLENNLNKVDWYDAIRFNKNPNILALVRKGYSLIQTTEKMTILQNPHIFTLDTKAMMDQCKPFCEELCAKALSPTRFKRHLDMYNYIIGVDEIWENDDI